MIVQLVSPILIHWKEICPMDSAIQQLNNWDVVKRLRRLLATCSCRIRLSYRLVASTSLLELASRFIEG